ncbi:hypothetical protein GCM10027160_10040 [Streptomyces calidiresistens]|uniref:MFS transporter n=1 Tax=Streptomyces calidiresistens TaxID=1485586 RepID=A0A7W3T5K7_9ACTN|nr:MFS transporter [Streptomyces calidiresistens]MBB0231208.1 MFS transporter [Streptomyces calidiresistens]
MDNAPHRDRWGTVTAAGLAVLLAQADASAVVVALPVITEELSTRPSIAQWVVLGYLAPLVALSLGAGRWVDTAPVRRALVVSAVSFGVLGVACGLSPHIGVLIALRVLQGCAAVVLLALAPLLVTTAVRPVSRGRAFGLLVLLGTLGAVLGPVVGGWLTGTVGWPWIFHLNVPVVAAIVLLGIRALPAGGRLPAPGTGPLVEAAVLGTGLLALLLGPTLAVEAGPRWAPAALLVVPAIVLWARRPESVPVRELLTRPGVAGPHLALLLAYPAVFAVVFTTPFLLREDMGLTPGRAGAVLLAPALAMGVAGPVGGYAADRLGPRRVARTGALVLIPGALLVAAAAPAPGPGGIVAGLALLGLGFGLLNGQAQVLALNAAPPHRYGMTAGTTNLARQLGIALGTALGALCWAGAGDGPGAVRGVALFAVLLAAALAVILSRTRVPGGGPDTGALPNPGPRPAEHPPTDEQEPRHA